MRRWLITYIENDGDFLVEDTMHDVKAMITWGESEGHAKDKLWEKSSNFEIIDVKEI